MAKLTKGVPGAVGSTLNGPDVHETKPESSPKKKEKKERAFNDLHDLLCYPRKLTVGTLATAIERVGVWSYDRYGRFKCFKSDTPEAMRALDALAEIRQWEIDPSIDHEVDEHPLDKISQQPSWHPLLDFGWLKKDLPDFESIQSTLIEEPTAGKSKGRYTQETLLRTIGALLGYISGEIENVAKHPKFHSEAQLISVIQEEYKSVNRGLGDSTLSHLFPDAKKALQVPPKPMK